MGSEISIEDVIINLVGNHLPQPGNLSLTATSSSMLLHCGWWWCLTAGGGGVSLLTANIVVVIHLHDLFELSSLAKATW